MKWYGFSNIYPSICSFSTVGPSLYISKITSKTDSPVKLTQFKKRAIKILNPTLKFEMFQNTWKQSWKAENSSLQPVLFLHIICKISCPNHVCSNMEHRQPLWRFVNVYMTDLRCAFVLRSLLFLKFGVHCSYVRDVTCIYVRFSICSNFV